MFSPQHILLSRYRYDPLDRLISHAQSTVPNHRFYCKSRLVTEIQEALRHSIVQHGDLLLAQHRHENDALATTTLLATDLQRSVLHTLEKNTGRQAIAYAPYGHRSAESGLTSLLEFNGERPDPVTGHYLLGNGYRAFNPILMRFNSPDSLSPFEKGGVNSYTYCLGDPINRGDPSGRVPIYVFSKATRTISINKSTIPTVRELLPNVSNKMAKRVVKKMNRAEMRIQKKSRDVVDRVSIDKQRNYSPLTKPTLELQTRAANIINSDNRIDPSALPNPLRKFATSLKEQNETTKEFYNLISDTPSGYAMGTRVESLADGRIFNQLIKSHPAIVELAQKYKERIATSISNMENLSAKQLNLLISIVRT